MKSNISICCGLCLDEVLSHIIENISPEAVESIYTEEKMEGDKNRNFVNLNSKAILSENELADCLSQWIINNYEKRIMSEILRYNFAGLTAEDIMIIVNETEKQIDEEIHQKHNRLISEALAEYFSQCNVLNIEGFVRFRLNEYRDSLENVIYDTINAYLAEKEYEAFIDMLRSYVEMQYPVIELIHIIENNDGSFTLYDFSGNNISVVCKRELSREMPEALLNDEDKLIGILLVLIPKRIIWHKSSEQKHSNLFNTIKIIFNERLSMCEGCSLCKK